MCMFLHYHHGRPAQSARSPGYAAEYSAGLVTFIGTMIVGLACSRAAGTGAAAGWSGTTGGDTPAAAGAARGKLLMAGRAWTAAA